MNPYTNLPEKIQFFPFAKSDWKMPQSQPELQPLMTDLRDYLEHKFFLWKQDPQFKFVFPPSAFNQIGRPLITYHQPETLDDNQEVRPLSQKQLAQIKEEGTFFVESNYYAIPYKWKLNSWIYKGYANRIETFYRGLALVFSQLYQFPKRVTSDYISLKKGCIRIVEFVPDLMNVLIGIRKVYERPPNYVYMIQRLRSIQSFKVSIRNKLYEYLYVPLLPKGEFSSLELHAKWVALDNEFAARLGKLKSIDNQFSITWEKQKKIISKRLKQQYKDEKTINLRYKEEAKRVRNSVIKNVFKQIPAEVIEEVLYFVICCEIVQEKKNKMCVDLAASKKEFEVFIRENYKVKKYCEDWRQDQINRHAKEEQKRLEEEMIETTEHELIDNVFSKYCQMIPDGQLLQKLVKDNPPEKIPNRNFECTYKLFPPYQVQPYPSYEGIRYRLVKQKDVIVSTNYIGWKIVLYFIRWYTWTRNVMYWLFRGLWGGRLSLKVLFLCRPFNPRYSVDPITGELGRSKQIQWNPIVYQFGETWRDIAKQRREFEEAPDNGFFGKTCSRMFSLFYNYIIRLIIYMFIWLLVLKPIVIIVNVVMLTIISATAIVWIPIILVIYGVWNMLIYNFDLDERYSGRIFQRFFPLLLLPLKLVFNVFYTLFAMLGILFHPFLALLLLLWSILRICVKTIMDFFMLGFIKCCARSPVRDTKIAWRVSGPGLSRDYYQTIREQDVYILVQAEIQRMHLDYIKQKYENEIRSVVEYPSSLISSILKPFNVTYNAMIFNQLQSSVYFYNNKIQEQYNHEIMKFPNKPGNNIRFNQDELQKYLGRSHQILMNYIRKQGAEFLYSQLNVDREEETEQLVYKLWISIFQNEQIFEPFEDLDHRFQLINDRQDDAIQSVLRSIAGDPEYKQKIVSLKFLNKVKIQETRPILVTEMLNSMMKYRQREYGDSKTYVWQGLFFNFNAKDEADNESPILFDLSRNGVQEHSQFH